jgi:hypothetical protein
MKAKDIKQRENFMLTGSLSELEWKPRTEAEVVRDLFKGTDPEKMIDAYETQLGIRQHQVAEEKTQVYKCVFLKPCADDEDRTLLQEFYNNTKRYQVINRNDNWTQRGDLVIFLEYFENMDEREEQPQV